MHYRLISLLNLDTIILLKAHSERLKNVLSSLTSTQQTAHTRNRFIGENVRLIFDIVDTNEIVTT